MSTFVSDKQKAVAAFVATLVVTFTGATTSALVAVGDGASFGDLSTVAWLTIAGAVVTSTGLVTGAVYGTANRPTE